MRFLSFSFIYLLTYLSRTLSSSIFQHKLTETHSDKVKHSISRQFVRQNELGTIYEEKKSAWIDSTNLPLATGIYLFLHPVFTNTYDIEYT